MNRAEQDPIDRLNRAAEEEKIASDRRAVQPKETKPPMVMVAATLAATVIILGLLWMSNGRDDGSGSRPVAEQRN